MSKDNAPEINTTSLSSLAIVFEYRTKQTSNKGNVKESLLKELKKNSCELELDDSIFQFKVVKKLPPHKKYKHVWLIKIRPKPIDISSDSVNDFKDSGVFYGYCRKKESTVKVVSDEYSQKRAHLLFGKVIEIESYFREFIVEHYSDQLRNEEYTDKNRGEGNHLVSWLDTSTLMISLLQSRASETYFLQRIADAETEEEKIAAYNATILDESNFSSIKSDLEEFVKIRNNIMHSRIISVSDYKRYLGVLDRIESAIKTKHMLKALEGIVLPDMSAFIGRMQDITAQYLEMADNVRAVYDAYSQQFEQIHKSLVKPMEEMKKSMERLSNLPFPRFDQGNNHKEDSEENAETEEENEEKNDS